MNRVLPIPVEFRAQCEACGSFGRHRTSGLRKTQGEEMKIRMSDDFKRFRAQRKLCDRFWWIAPPASIVVLIFVIICTLGS